MRRLIIACLFLAILTTYYFFTLQTRNEESMNTRARNEEILVVRTLQVLKKEERLFEGRAYVNQTLRVKVMKGLAKGREVEVMAGNVAVFENSAYKAGDKLLVGYQKGSVGDEVFYVIGYERTDVMIWLTLLFIIVTLLVARRQGLYSILGMLISFLFIITFLLPSLSEGQNPVLISLLTALFLLPSTFYLSHGFNKKTVAAVCGTFISLGITGILASIVVKSAHLTGIIYEEVETLLYVTKGNIHLQGLLIAGVVISALGVLDDIAITQASIVEELKKSSPSLSLRELYQRSMRVGRDHIGSVINTLILVYVGGSLSTLLLFTQFPRPPMVMLNNEIVLIQIAGALIGSIGVILTVPITTFLACYLYKKALDKRK